MVKFITVEDNNRGGRHHGGGYYDYSEAGKTRMGTGLLDKYLQQPISAIADDDVKDRLLFRQVVETLEVFGDQGVLRTVTDGNIGSIMGIGAPVWTGGFLFSSSTLTDWKNSRHAVLS